MAGEENVPLPSDASPFDTEYVHFMPSTVSTKAKLCSEEIVITITGTISFAIFI
jgi:hypothetical protein